ncbi:MAG: hypothetical protein NDJ89_12610 [Oligoflexia bacterium]|nr:hypothetical protein [Oligoflexia bacterium]
MVENRSLSFFLVLALALSAVAGCSSKLSRFDVIQMQGAKLTGSGGEAHQILRAEVGAQGSGTARSANHVLERVTIGGSYLRRPAAATSGTSVAPGLHSGQ